MKTTDLIADAISNTFRSKTRTILTVLAIFIGAFTLTITTGLGTGINRYIDQTVAEVGAPDVLTVTHATDESASDGPQVYEPDQVKQGGPAGQGPLAKKVDAITEADLDTIAAIDGVRSVEPLKRPVVDFVRVGDGTRYQVGVGSFVPGMQVQVAAGDQPDAGAPTPEVAIPADYVEALGFDDAADAIGHEVEFGLTDAAGDEQLVSATIVGVAETGLAASGVNAAPNTALTDALAAAQAVDAPEGRADTFPAATVRFDPAASADEVQALKDDLAAAGFDATTVEDSLGTFTAVIDGIVLVLDVFAVIALLAASFGIVNTLFMSVQERTREIGLMKAMGMGSGRVFGLFSSEATFIGLLGSAIGVGVGMIAGTAIGGALTSTILSDLTGLTLIAFDPLSVAMIVVLVMAIGFAAGTLPAARAARQDPIESLRYE